MNTPIRFSVPATAANLGPGFDSLGMALGLRNIVTIEEADTPGFTYVVEGEGAGKIPTNEHNLLGRAMRRVFKAVGPYEGPYRKVTMRNRVPLGSGLGSSATAIAGGMLAANLLSDVRLSPGDLLKLAVEMEGHPDNVVPAVVGGLIISSYADDTLLVRAVPLPPTNVVIVTPARSASTKEQRAALPKKVPLADAAANIGRALLVVEALRESDYVLLRDAIHDRLHVPTRRKAIPGYEAVVKAGMKAGAAAVTISGAGPSLIAFAPKEHAKIGKAMREAFTANGVRARSWVLPVEAEGFRLEPHSR